jgi:hypothetical protein
MAATHVTEMADAGEVVGFQRFQHQHGIDAGVTATFGQSATKACLLTPTRSDDARAASHCGLFQRVSSLRVAVVAFPLCTFVFLPIALMYSRASLAVLLRRLWDLVWINVTSAMAWLAFSLP